MIKVFKLFIVTIFFSSMAVWLSNNPGNVSIVWKDYLIETNTVGLAGIFFILLILLFSVYFLLSKVKNFPKNFIIKRRESYLVLGNKALDDIAINIFMGDKEGLDLNSRKLKKYFNNDLFTTFLLFHSSITSGNFEKATKYLNILKKIPKADYLYKRGNVILAFKQDNINLAQELLLKYKKSYVNDLWISEKLAVIYCQKKEWKLALKTLESINSKNDVWLNELKANLLVTIGDTSEKLLKLGPTSFLVINDLIKDFIKNNNLKKASSILEKSWKNLHCIDLITNFLEFENKGSADSLKRHKLLSKSIKKGPFLSDETRLALAISSYQAKIWGECQKYLDEIDRNNLDERMINLYKEISKKKSGISLPVIPKEQKRKPLWFCQSCKNNFSSWSLVCLECNSVNNIKWPKSIQNLKKKNNFLNNALGHFPKMK